jgi:hypothetical protein
MGEELHAELVSKADHLRYFSDGLRERADAFEAADREWQEALARIHTQTWPSLNQIQWGTSGEQEPPWWLVELVIGMFPFGDAYDILKELFRLITQGETDELILILALLGLVADIGWADGPAPDPADPANAAFALLKGLVKQIPPGPARDAIKEAFLRAARNTDEAPRFFAAFAQLAKHEEILTGLKNNPGALAAVLDAGPETMEFLARNEEVTQEILKHGDDAVGLLKNPDALDAVVQHGPEAVEAVLHFGEEGVDLAGRYGDLGVEMMIRHTDGLVAEEVGRLLRFETIGADATYDVSRAFGGPLGAGSTVPHEFVDREVIALGRLQDTQQANLAGERILEFSDWTMEENFLKLNEAIRNGD